MISRLVAHAYRDRFGMVIENRDPSERLVVQL